MTAILSPSSAPHIVLGTLISLSRHLSEEGSLNVNTCTRIFLNEQIFDQKDMLMGRAPSSYCCIAWKIVLVKATPLISNCPVKAATTLHTAKSSCLAKTSFKQRVDYSIQHVNFISSALHSRRLLSDRLRLGNGWGSCSLCKLFDNSIQNE